MESDVETCERCKTKGRLMSYICDHVYCDQCEEIVMHGPEKALLPKPFSFNRIIEVHKGIAEIEEFEGTEVFPAGAGWRVVYSANGRNVFELPVAFWVKGISRIWRAPYDKWVDRDLWMEIEQHHSVHGATNEAGFGEIVLPFAANWIGYLAPGETEEALSERIDEYVERPEWHYPREEDAAPTGRNRNDLN